MSEREQLSRYNCGRTDDKARRRMNVSSRPANITAAEIEAGVTLERLTALNVPVFRYYTQVTIHGTLPDFNPEAKQNGYKAIFRNGNGSLGVRYVAIDAEKKANVVLAARHSLKPRAESMVALMDSQGLQLQNIYHIREEAIAAAESMRQLAALFIGSVSCFALPWGAGFAVVASVGAIPVANLWPLIAALYGIATPAQLAELKAAADAETDARRKVDTERYAKERAEREAKTAAALGEVRAKLEAQGLQPLVAVPIPGRFLYVKDSWSNGPGAYPCTVTLGPFKRLYIGKAGSKRRVVTDSIRRQWQAAAAAGNIYPAD